MKFLFVPEVHVAPVCSKACGHSVPTNGAFPCLLKHVCSPLPSLDAPETFNQVTSRANPSHPSQSITEGLGERWTCHPITMLGPSCYEICMSRNMATMSILWGRLVSQKDESEMRCRPTSWSSNTQFCFTNSVPEQDHVLYVLRAWSQLSTEHASD